MTFYLPCMSNQNQLFVSLLHSSVDNVDEKGQLSETDMGPSVCTCTMTYTGRSWVVLRLIVEIDCDSPSEEGNVSWSFLSRCTFYAYFHFRTFRTLYLL